MILINQDIFIGNDPCSITILYSAVLYHASDCTCCFIKRAVLGPGKRWICKKLPAPSEAKPLQKRRKDLSLTVARHLKTILIFS